MLQVERFFRQSRDKLNMFNLFRLCRKDEIVRQTCSTLLPFWPQSRTLLRHCCWCGRGLTVWRPSVRPSVCPVGAHSQQPTKGSMRRGQRTFHSNNDQDGHAYFHSYCRNVGLSRRRLLSPCCECFVVWNLEAYLLYVTVRS